MNKISIMGRITRDPEVRYSQAAEPVAVARYTVAVNRRFKKDEADFIPCVAFGKQGEFAERYLKKGQLVCICGRLQVRNWEDNEGKKRTTVEVVTEEHYFAESKKVEEKLSNKVILETLEMYPVEEVEDEDLPF